MAFVNFLLGNQQRQARIINLVRIIIYDGEITHFSSYNPNQPSEAFGVRFDYKPYEILMDELFEQKWKLGKEMNERVLS